MPTNQQMVLETLLANNQVPAFRKDFAKSLASARHLSQKQEFWVNKIIEEIVNPVAKVTVTIDSSKIVKLFEGAKKHLKHPKVTLQTPNGNPLRCAMAGDRSKYAGSIMLTAGSFGSTFYGSIKPTGELWIAPGGRAIEADLKTILNEFANDPAGTAMKHGKLTSHCCFCALPLSTPESLAVGYGDTCADHWDLPWGNKKKSGKEILAEVKTDMEVAEAAFKYGPLNDDLIQDDYS